MPFAPDSNPPSVQCAQTVRHVSDDRITRVLWIDEVAAELRGGMPASAEARAFVGAGLTAWLRGNGALERDIWRVAAEKGSHDTPANLLRKLHMRGPHRDERTNDD